MKADPPFADDILFHAQQAAAESLKAFLPGTEFHFVRHTTWSHWERLRISCVARHRNDPACRRACLECLLDFAGQFHAHRLDRKGT
jgi:hypothetical protein